MLVWWGFEGFDFWSLRCTVLPKWLGIFKMILSPLAFLFYVYYHGNNVLWFHIFLLVVLHHNTTSWIFSQNHQGTGIKGSTKGYSQGQALVLIPASCVVRNNWLLGSLSLVRKSLLCDGVSLGINLDLDFLFIKCLILFIVIDLCSLDTHK